MFKPTKIIIHHSGVSRVGNNKQYEAINSYHKSKGWGKIGYHFLIEPDGLIEDGRREIKQGVHTIGQNEVSFGICLAGNFDIEEPTDEQMRALKTLLRRLRTKYNVAFDKVKFHSDFSTKTCPGTNFTREMLKKSMNLRELKRDFNGGFWFVKDGDTGKQKIDFSDPVTANKLLLTIISREFGVDNVSPDYLNNFKDKKYV